MTAFFLIDEGSMHSASNTNYQPVVTFGIPLQRNEAVYLGWGRAGDPPINADAYPVNLPSIQELVSQHPGFPPGLPLAPIVHPLQPQTQTQCEPLIRPDSATTSDEEIGVDSYEPGDFDSYVPEDFDTYEPEDLDMYESRAEPNAQAVVELPPSKRSRPFAGDISQADLADLHRFTTQPPPQVRVYDQKEILAQLFASQDRPQVKAWTSYCTLFG
ncbi:hypothetical protein C7T35_40290 [Variovorax sp. WS11]|uniref:hypothetical protein n=1 Tax=Variovorax sp. WS11 TaxID=1105204 RepID=UPI000D0C987C|nr:hypothetical protein [Variovorax sp. WS11]NDZ15795.1 hypothetical protein [Variovorax sp. WS11]PSL78932.1 hypothetical protein C7T35_40290 [Variovorax sp. WS11]